MVLRGSLVDDSVIRDDQPNSTLVYDKVSYNYKIKNKKNRKYSRNVKIYWSECLQMIRESSCGWTFFPLETSCNLPLICWEFFKCLIKINHTDFNDPMDYYSSINRTQLTMLALTLEVKVCCCVLIFFHPSLLNFLGVMNIFSLIQRKRWLCIHHSCA